MGHLMVTMSLDPYAKDPFQATVHTCLVPPYIFGSPLPTLTTSTSFRDN